MKSRNSEELASFVAFCEQYPDLRFWQALAAWSQWPYVLVTTDVFTLPLDTFAWEKTQPPPPPL